MGVTAQQYYRDSGLTESSHVHVYDRVLRFRRKRLGAFATRQRDHPGCDAAERTRRSSGHRHFMPASDLTWLPSTDNSGVGSYIVFWGLSPGALVQVARTAGTSTSYNSAPLTAGTTYYYGVEAADTSGNVSAMSAIVSATTPTPPSAPASLRPRRHPTAASVSRGPPRPAGGCRSSITTYTGAVRLTISARSPSAAQTSYSDTSMNQATAYYYAVKRPNGADLRRCP